MEHTLEGSQVLEFEVPELNDELLEELLRRISPLVRIDGKLFHINPVDPRGVSFIWAPTPLKEANDLEKIAVIPTLHTFGYHGMFKPSIEEVLRSIPHNLIDHVVAFEVEGPGTSQDLNRTMAVVDGGNHLGRTTLYGSA